MKKRLAAALVASILGMGIPSPYRKTIPAQYSKRKPHKTESDHWYIKQAEAKRDRRRKRNLRLVIG